MEASKKSCEKTASAVEADLFCRGYSAEAPAEGVFISPHVIPLSI